MTDREAADAIEELEQKLSKIPPYPKCKGCGVGVDDTLPQLCDDISQCYVYTKRNYFCLEEENKKLRAELEDVKREREKGCEYCNNKELPLEGGAHDFRILGNAIFYYDATFGWEGTTIERCPWCGRPLKGTEE